MKNKRFQWKLNKNVKQIEKQSSFIVSDENKQYYKIISGFHIINTCFM